MTSGGSYNFLGDTFNRTTSMLCLIDKAPLSKSLLPLPTVLTVLLTVFLPQYQDLLIHNLQVVRQGKQVRYYTSSPEEFNAQYQMYTFNTVY